MSIPDRLVDDYVRRALAGDVVTCRRCFVTFGLGFLVGDAEEDRVEAQAFLVALGWNLRDDVPVCPGCTGRARNVN